MTDDPFHDCNSRDALARKLTTILETGAASTPPLQDADESGLGGIMWIMDKDKDIIEQCRRGQLFDQSDNIYQNSTYATRTYYQARLCAMRLGIELPKADPDPHKGLCDLLEACMVMGKQPPDNEVATGTSKWPAIKEWAERYLNEHPDNAPKGFNAFLNLIRAERREWKGCSPDTFRTAIKNSPQLQAWEGNTKLEADNADRAKRPPESIEESTLPADSGHADGIEDTKAIPVDRQVHMRNLIQMPIEKLLEKTKHLFHTFIEHQNAAVERHLRKDPDKQWANLISDPKFKQDDPESIAQLYVSIENMYEQSLDTDKDRHTDPKKMKYVRKVRT